MGGDNDLDNVGKDNDIRGLHCLINGVNFWGGGNFKAEAYEVWLGFVIRFFSLTWHLRAKISDFWSLMIALRRKNSPSTFLIGFCFAFKFCWRLFKEDWYIFSGKKSPKGENLFLDLFMIKELSNENVYDVNDKIKWQNYIHMSKIMQIYT